MNRQAVGLRPSLSVDARNLRVNDISISKMNFYEMWCSLHLMQFCGIKFPLKTREIHRLSQFLYKYAIVLEKINAKIVKSIRKIK